MKAESREEELTQDINAKIDYEGVFFRLLIQINLSVDMGDFKKNIDLLECLMFPYLDDEFQSDLDGAKENFNKDISRFKGNIPESVFYSIEWGHLKAVYSALIKLAYRRKMMPQRIIKEKVI